MKFARAVALIVLLLMCAAPSFAQKPDFLTEEESDKLREAQEPSERIQLYLDMAQERLTRFEAARANPALTTEDLGKYLDRVLSQYVSINEELKSWIEDRYDHNADMRKGLRAVLDLGSRQLEELRRIQQSPDNISPAYSDTLRDAVDDFTDTLNGATKALADQQKKFAAEKQEEKVDAHEAKLRSKEEKKRTKEEERLRKKEKKTAQPAEPDQN